MLFDVAASAEDFDVRFVVIDWVSVDVMPVNSRLGAPITGSEFEFPKSALVSLFIIYAIAPPCVMI